VSCSKDPATDSGDIELYIETLEVQPEGGNLRFNYTVTKPVAGVELTASCDADWVSNIIVTSSFVSLDVAKNISGELRSSSIVLSYGGSRKSLEISQQPFVDPISLKVDSVDATSVTISVATRDESTTWIGQIVGREWFEAYDEEQIFAEDMAYYVSMASEAEVELETLLGQILSTGSHSGIRMAGLDTESEYVVYVYGMNTAGEKTTSIYYEAFTTTPPYEGNDVTFDINVELNRALASISIQPSHEGVAYYHNLTTREHFEECGGDIDALARDVVATALDNYLYWEYTEEEFFEYNTYYLADNYEFEAMANTEYLVFAFKWNDKCERLSEVSYKWFEVGEIPASENVITMDISNVTQSTFDIATTTTTPDPYVIFPIHAQEIAKMRSDDAIFKHILSTYGTSGLAYYICEGDVAGTFSGLDAGTEYAVLAFGYEAGTLTTSIVRKNITTAEAGDIEACIYNIEVTDIDDREAKVKITPSDYSITYYWNVFEASMTEEDIKAYILNSYNSTYYGDYWEFSYYELAQGAVDSHITHLKPSTDYKIVVIPMNPNTFEYLGTMRSGGEFRTSDAVIADITITAGFDAYYDGDEVYAIEPDYCSSWQGWVVVPMSVTIDGEYSSFLYTMFEYVDGLEDAEQYSDDLLIDNLYNVGAYWTPAYFRGEWDKTIMIAAVAFDYDGNPSPVYRSVHTFTREGAGDAQEFVDYYMGTINTSALSADKATKNTLSIENINITHKRKHHTSEIKSESAMRFDRK
jgi:hypothetical protein